MNQAFAHLARVFQTQTRIPLSLTYSSSGVLAAQLRHGAPYDLFASADLSYFDTLQGQLAEAPLALGEGALVIWVAHEHAPASLQALHKKDILAIANPAHAPYGRAAQQALQAVGRWNTQPIVRGNSVRHAQQFVESGNASVALIAQSQAMQSGSFTQVPLELYTPPSPAIALLSQSSHKIQAQAFLRFLRGAQAKKILISYGLRAQQNAPLEKKRQNSEARTINWTPLWLSYKVATLATFLALFVGVGLATLLAQRRFWGREWLDAALTLPMILPPTVLGYYLLTLLGNGSLLGKTWYALTGGHLVFTTTGCVLAAFVGALPLVIKSARTAIEGVDPSLLQAAQCLGASPWRIYTTITLPLAARGIFAGTMLGWARALGDFGVTLMIAGAIPGQTQTAALYIYDQVLEQRPVGGMIAVLSASALLVLFLVNRLGQGSHAAT